MNVRPLYDRIIVKRSEEEESTRNGIFIPDSAKEKPQEGEVVAVGRGEGSTTVKLSRWMSRRAIAFSLASTQAARRRSMALSTRSCAKTMF